MVGSGFHLWEPYDAPLKQNGHLPLIGLIGISIPLSGTLGQYVIDQMRIARPGCNSFLQRRDN